MDHVLIRITPFTCSLSEAIYLSSQPVVPRQSATQRYLFFTINFNARNKIFYHRVGRIIKWKATCVWAVQLSRSSFGMFPVLVDLQWFEMLLVKVSVMSLQPQYLSRCLGFGVTFVIWVVRILRCHCWVCSALCIQSGEYGLMWRTGVESCCFY